MRGGGIRTSVGTWVGDGGREDEKWMAGWKEGVLDGEGVGRVRKGFLEVWQCFRDV